MPVSTRFLLLLMWLADTYSCCSAEAVGLPKLVLADRRASLQASLDFAYHIYLCCLFIVAFYECLKASDIAGGDETCKAGIQ